MLCTEAFRLDHKLRVRHRQVLAWLPTNVGICPTDKCQ